MEKGMRENYEEPIVEMIELEADVITSSTCPDDTNFCTCQSGAGL